LENLPSLYKKYGDDVIYLLGGQLYGMSADLPENYANYEEYLKERREMECLPSFVPRFDLG